MKDFFDYHKSLLKRGDLGGIQILFFSLFAFFLPFKMIYCNIITIIMIVVFFVQLYKEGKTAKIKPIFYFLILPYMASICGMLYTDNLKHGLFLLELRLALLFCPLIVFIPRLCVEEQNIKQILKALTLGLVTVFWISFAETLFKLSQLQSTISWDLFIYHLADYLPLTHVYFGMYSVLAIVFLLRQVLLDKKVTFLVIFYLLTLGLFMALFVPKTALIALVLIIILLLFSFRNSIKKKNIYIILILFTIVISIMFVLPKSRQRLRQFTFGYSHENMINDKSNYSALRTVPFYCSLELITENWLSGLGTGDVQDKMDEWYTQHQLSEIVLYDSHNQYFDWILAFGILGMLLCLSPIVILLVNSIHYNNILYLSFAVLLLLSFCTENILNNNKGVMFYSFFNSLFATQLVKKA